MTKTCKLLAPLAAAFALTACERAPDAPPPATSLPLDPTGGLAPPLVTPGENTPSSQPPSYEVSIATAAAEHNKALARCAGQPEAVRVRCEQEANVAFGDVQKSLEPLRGNQP
jgi:hypothetical protein